MFRSSLPLLLFVRENLSSVNISNSAVCPWLSPSPHLHSRESSNSPKELPMATTAFQTPRKEQTTAPRSVKLTETEKRQILENLDIEGALTETDTSVRPSANVPRALLQWRTRNDVSKPIFKICWRALRLDTRLKSLAFRKRFER